jgi:hypothetical protein
MKTHTSKQIACTVFSIKTIVTFFLFFTTICQPVMAQNSGYPVMTFHSPVLISGVDNEVNAVYLFPNVCTGVDANITIMGIYNGAALNNIDDTAGVGYYDAFQPYVVAAANDSSYIDWKIEFKVAGTTQDTILPKVAVTGIDVDGDGANLKEFIVASTPGTFGLAANTFLQYTFDGVRSTAISTVDNFPLIDTSERRAMFQMNFTNVSSILYRNGAVSTYGSTEIRQTCIYFKSFFEDEWTLLPIKLLSFTASDTKEKVVLSWSATNEDKLAYYTVQKSTDGITWKNIRDVTIGSNDINNYSYTDFERNQTNIYYRLKSVATSGLPVYSKTLKVNYNKNELTTVRHNTIITDNINLQISALQSDEYTINVYSITGRNITQTENKIQSGVNHFTMNLPVNLSRGVYILSIKNRIGEVIYDSKLIKD